jgi:hypothetical protein
MCLQHNKPTLEPIQVLTMVKFGPIVLLCLHFKIKDPCFSKDNCVCEKFYGWIFFCDINAHILFITFV